MTSIASSFPRYFHTSHIYHKVLPNNLKGKSTSSQQWLIRQLNDPYVKQARYENYRARSAFKLIEIDDEYKILKPGMRVIECGAAPGAWTQVLVKRLQLEPLVQPLETIQEKIPGKGFKKGSLVIAIDKNAMHPIEGAIVLPHTDFTSPINQGKILSILDGELVDAVISDMAPNASGNRSLDHDAIINLCLVSLKFALQVLRPGGTYLTKYWDGSRTLDFKTTLEKFFGQVDFVKPPASRCNSAEHFLLARKFKGTKLTIEKK